LAVFGREVAGRGLTSVYQNPSSLKHSLDPSSYSTQYLFDKTMIINVVLVCLSIASVGVKEVLWCAILYQKTSYVDG
jgi:hypothetical protein